MKPLILAILDGWGWSPHRAGNPIAAARKPTFDMLDREYPPLLLQASGTAVGLPWGMYGNSEVGHLTIGAGRVVLQYQSRILASIDDGSWFKNPILKKVFSSSRVHLVGLLTSGSVHAEYRHILALLDLAKRMSTPRVFLHLFTDGKDGGMREGTALLRRLADDIAQREIPALIATVIGRDYGMDRDDNLDKTKTAYDLITQGKGERVEDIATAVESQNVDDMMIPALTTPTYDGVGPEDGILFFNFREDSMRQLYRLCKDRHSFTMTQYLDERADRAAFSRPDISDSLAETASKQGLRQLHIAERSKFGHVTYFFNGLRERPFRGEDDVLAADHRDTADRIIKVLKEKSHDLIVMNFADPDVLAHLGDFERTKQGIEQLDESIGKLVDAVRVHDAALVITADHGNAEALIDRISGEPESRHDDSPVPLYLVDGKVNGQWSMVNGQEVPGILADVAPTVLELMGIPQPAAMTGKSLLPELLGRSR